MEVAENDQKFVEADLLFHLMVARAGHNELLEQFYHLVRKLLTQVINELIQFPLVKPESIALQKAAQAHMDYIERLLDTYE